ncbi:MAG TPA: histidine phosphatase family protein [Bacteroidales bacterium]|jgi:phosphohistidine phosphatase|nr:histidine phosphatase family protein [Bacteroidales bacterium]NLH33888.1 phosphohistidine phosphatase [Lentimicrobium sp.]MBP7874827.1 histidine phosphatase family protein [Bacteroidales bacterium]MCZ2282269.1 histidine phosphatase family protein [Bacteroidales bacterium]HPX34434.1 histidine phosphatase family protein [Bacteroidales bacterium]
MKTIYILRHAKSSWDFSHLNDVERPLIEKGINRTNLIARYLNKNNITPDLIISSAAVRALETARIVANAVKYPINKIHISKSLYSADEDNIITQLFDISDHLHTVMLVGHNPTLTYFVNHYLEQKIEWLPTSGLVSISFDTDSWPEISNAGYVVNFLITPSMLKKE